MPCPHGNGPAEHCSQCRGAAPSKIELVDGKLVVNGAAVATTAEHTAAAEETMLSKAALRRGGRAPRACSICRLPGHNAKTCNRRV
jgi:hypothetical protein